MVVTQKYPANIIVTFFQTIDNIFAEQVTTAFYKTGVPLYRSKKSNLKKIASEILNILRYNNGIFIGLIVKK